MTTGRAWAIKGVSDKTRDAALEAAHAAGLNVGQWIDQVLARAAAEARQPKPPPATREDMAELLDARLEPIAATLGRLAERLASLEEAGRPAGPEPTSGMTLAPSPVEAEEIGEQPEAGLERALAPDKTRGRRRLPEDVRARIAELYRAGHSAYAISKELGVSYPTVRAHVKALQTE